MVRDDDYDRVVRGIINAHAQTGATIVNVMRKYLIHIWDRLRVKSSIFCSPYHAILEHCK